MQRNACPWLLTLVAAASSATVTELRLTAGWRPLLPHPVSGHAFHLARVILKESDWNEQNFWIYFRGETPATHDLLQFTANRLLQQISGVPVQVGYCKDMERFYNLHTRLFFVDSVEAFAALVERQHIRAIRSDHVRYLVLLDGHAAELETRIMSGIFRIMFEMFMMNVNVVVPHGSAPYRYIEVYTYFPYSAGDCQSFTPVHIRTLRYGSATPTLTSLYPPKMRNMNGCALVVMLGNRPPFIQLLPGRRGFDAISGTDGELLKQLGRKMNFTIEVVRMNESVPNRVYPNGTMLGVYKSLENQEINLTLGDFTYSPQRLNYFTLSQTYYQSNMRILIKSSGSYSPLEVLFYPYKTSAWCLFLSVYALRWLALKFLGRPLERALPAPFRSLLLGMWIMALFEVRSCYEGSYFKFMHKRPLKPSPTTFRELRQLEYVILCGYTGTNFEHVVRSQGFSYQLSENESIGQQFSNLGGNYGILMKEEYWATYMQSHPEQRADFHFLKEPLVMDFHCVYFPRYSHLVEQFDELLILYHDAGLTKKLVAEYVQTPRLLRRQLQRVDDAAGEMLTLSHLRGVFQLLIALWAVACAALVLELLARRCRRLRQLLNRLE